MQSCCKRTVVLLTFLYNCKVDDVVILSSCVEKQHVARSLTVNTSNNTPGVRVFGCEMNALPIVGEKGRVASNQDVSVHTV